MPTTIIAMHNQAFTACRARCGPVICNLQINKGKVAVVMADTAWIFFEILLWMLKRRRFEVWQYETPSGHFGIRVSSLNMSIRLSGLTTDRPSRNKTQQPSGFETLRIRTWGNCYYSPKLALKNRMAQHSLKKHKLYFTKTTSSKTTSSSILSKHHF